MLEPEHFSGAAEPGLDFVAKKKRPVLPAKLLGAHEEIGLRRLAAFPLDRLDHKCGHVAFGQFTFERRDIIQRDSRFESFHERAEAFRETFAAHQGERTEAEPVKCALK